MSPNIKGEFIVTALVLFCAFSQASYAQTNCAGGYAEILGEDLTARLKNLAEATIEDQLRNSQLIEYVNENFSISKFHGLSFYLRGDLFNRKVPNAFSNSYALAAYVGNFARKEKEYFVLPKDDRLICLLGPLSAVLLSDGVTNHYALIYEILPEEGRVLVADPWYQKSFLLQGRNLLGVSAQVVDGNLSIPLTSVTFDELKKTLIGVLQSQYVMTPAVRQIYTEFKSDPEFEAWLNLQNALIASQDSIAKMRSAFGDIPENDTTKAYLLYADIMENLQDRLTSGQTNANAREREDVDVFQNSQLLFLGRSLPWSLTILLNDRLYQHGHYSEAAILMEESANRYPKYIELSDLYIANLIEEKKYSDAGQAIENAKARLHNQIDDVLKKGSLQEKIEYVWHGDETPTIINRLREIHFLLLMREMRKFGEQGANEQASIVYSDVDRLVFPPESRMKHMGLIGYYLYDWLMATDTVKDLDDLLFYVLEFFDKGDRALKANTVEAFYHYMMKTQRIDEVLSMTIGRIEFGTVLSRICNLANDGSVTPSVRKGSYEKVLAACSRSE